MKENYKNPEKEDDYLAKSMAEYKSNKIKSSGEPVINRY